MQKSIAIITARGGSKGIPRKNIQLLAAKPLVAHSIFAAQQCPYVSSCYVSTDDEEIATISSGYGAEIIHRPAALAEDLSTSAAAVEHALLAIDKKGQLSPYFVLLQPTSPFRSAKHLTECFQLLYAQQAEGAISVTEMQHHPYKCLQLKNGQLTPLFQASDLHAARQSLPAVYRPNGAIYICKTDRFLQEGLFYTEKSLPYRMSQHSSIDIDSPYDLRIARLLAEEQDDSSPCSVL